MKKEANLPAPNFYTYNGGMGKSHGTFTAAHPVFISKESKESKFIEEAKYDGM